MVVQYFSTLQDFPALLTGEKSLAEPKDEFSDRARIPSGCQKFCKVVVY
jgi:hypothetical protein